LDTNIYNMKKNNKPAHPCFDVTAKHTNARVHLPVAPKCNMLCNYCSRKYDCVNESSPGVTSAILTPQQAAEYFKGLSDKLKIFLLPALPGLAILLLILMKHLKLSGLLTSITRI
jgi:MoaA/NifB/PqqE/SkfB family radical SAM enzyme